MANLGPVPVPVPPVIGPFPLKPDFGSAEELEPLAHVHRFDSPGLKTEQRFWRGPGARRFRLRKAQLTCHDYEDLRAHWNQARGIWASFPYTHVKQNGSTETVQVHYADPVLRFEHQTALLTGDPGLTLTESRDSAAPAGPYTVTSTDDGVPSSALLTALRQSEQELIPLIVIVTRDGLTQLFLSDRSVIIGAQEYLPRLLDWSGLTWSVDQNNDSASFRFGNADGVWTELFKTVSLRRAQAAFAFYHAGSSILHKPWSGTIRDWTRDPASRVIDIRAGDGIYELTLPYPTRQVSRTCWKEFKSDWCPYTGPLERCDKSWEQCVERGMTPYFGGARSKQEVRVFDNSTGTFGWGRSSIKSVSIAEDSVYQRVIQEIYTDIPMVVNCDVAMGRDESDYYSALGIVGEGPIAGFHRDVARHLLDNAPPHDAHGTNPGWRYSTGADPASPPEFFGLNQAPWNTVPAGATFSAGTAFAEIRRADAKGLQLSKVSDRKMQVVVTGGMGGWTWTAPGSRSWTQPLTNCVWVAVNVFLRGIGLKADYSRPDLFSAALMESYLQLQSIIDSAAIADTIVPKLVGSGTERQFPFRGILREQKPLRDWMNEILSCCLGYSYFLNNRLAIGIRVNSSVAAGNAFTRATVLENSFTAEPREASYNHLTAEFADEEYEWSLNNVQVYDIDHARLEGSYAGPRFRASRMPLAGVSNKSQASRLVMTRLKEELGGATAAEQEAARNVRLRSTVIALGAMPGDVCSYDDASLPAGRAEFRILRRTLNPDWSMDFEGAPATDAMYDAAIGPKPDDVPADPVPPERFQSMRGLAWLPFAECPEAGDPVAQPGSCSFALWQDYTLQPEGTYAPSVVVRGERTVNTFLVEDPCLIHDVSFATTGGSLPGGATYYFTAAQRNTAGQYAPLSNLAAIWIPPGTDTNKITLGPIEATESLPGYSYWMGTDPRRMIQQAMLAATPLPASIEVTGMSGARGMPHWAARAVRIKCKEVEHSGVAGLQVQQVLGLNQIVSSEFTGSPDAWVGQILSVVADSSDGSVPLWNFTITAFDASTGKLTVSPDCVRAAPEDSVEKDDVMIVRSRATSATATTITNTLWDNSVAEAQFGTATGLIPDAEIGLQIRIIAGKGAGQVRKVTGNTNLTHTIDPPWDVIPDTTSLYIVEYPDWIHEAECSPVTVPFEGQQVEIGVRVDNLTSNVALVAGFLIDDEGNETAEEFAVCREIFLWGQPYEVRTTAGASDETSLTDQTLRVDTTDGDVEVELASLDALNRAQGSGGYFGRTILIVNDGTGAGSGSVIVTPLPGDEFNTLEPEVVIESPGDWAEFVAGGDPADALSGRRAAVWQRSGRRRIQHPAFRLRRGRTRRKA